MKKIALPAGGIRSPLGDRIVLLRTWGRRFPTGLRMRDLQRREEKWYDTRRDLFIFFLFLDEVGGREKENSAN